MANRFVMRRAEGTDALNEAVSGIWKLFRTSSPVGFDTFFLEVLTAGLVLAKEGFFQFTRVLYRVVEGDIKDEEQIAARIRRVVLLNLEEALQQSRCVIGRFPDQ